MLPVLDDLLKYIADCLPSPLYSVVITFLSQSFATATSIARLCNLLLSRTPTEWGVQTFLPATISILAAYLALASLYRTTSWVLRTSFWFIKWGTIISILLAGASYYMGDGNDVVGNQGIIPNIGRYMIYMANGDQGSGEGQRRVKPRQGRKQKSQRPKAWDSFERHREWQYHDANNGQIEGGYLAAIIADAGDYVLEKSEWWAVIKNMWGSTKEHSEERSFQNTKSSKSPFGNSRSR